MPRMEVRTIRSRHMTLAAEDNQREIYRGKKLIIRQSDSERGRDGEGEREGRE